MIKDSSGAQRFFGVYRGIVFDNNDPTGEGRLRLQIPQVLAESVTGWAWPQNVAGIKVDTPAIGTGVIVQFEAGDPSYPIWTGTFGTTLLPGAVTTLVTSPSKAEFPVPDGIITQAGSPYNVDIVRSLFSLAKNTGTVKAIDGGSA
jgi:hypothetical protein